MVRFVQNMHRFGLAVLVFLLGVLQVNAVAAEPAAVDIQSLVQDIQKLHKEQGSLTLVMWFPVQYWEAFMANDARVTAKQKQDLCNAFRPYTVLAVVDGKLGAFGGLTYKSEAEVREKIQLVDAKGNTYSPLGEDDIQADTRNLVGAMKPAIAGVLGPMGKSMHIFMFPATDSDGKPIADAKNKGSFTVKLGKDEFRWKLPVGALLPAKQCPKCKEKGSGAWDFCPWCGSELQLAK